MKKAIGILLVLLGVLLLALNLFSVLHTPFDTSKGSKNLIGQILFHVTFGIVGFALLLGGIRLSKK